MMRFVIILFYFSVVNCIEEINELSSEVEHPNLNETGPLGLSTDLVYHFFSQRDPKNGFKVRITSVSELRNSDFRSNRDTLFIIHGWKNDNESTVNNEIRETILKTHNINVFVVDWSKMAGQNYISAKNAVVRVGQYIAEFILKVKQELGLSLSQVKFVGHSLGAHISGNAGAALQGRVDRIVGLDPAGPLFTVKDTDNRLDESDAQFVQIIHTNGGTLGFGVPMGHADYFPNGGRSQPGCGVDLTGSCAHSRAYYYYAESLNSNRFVAKKCDSITDYDKGRCTNGESSVMGRFESDYSARGSYYLNTNRDSPYAQG